MAYIDGGLVGAKGKEKAPAELGAAAGLAYQGSTLVGMGFVLSREEADAMIASDPKSGEVITPYLGGESINRLPELTPLRFAINFGEMDEADAQQFVAAWKHLQTFVKPERMVKDAEAYPRLVYEWWKYWHSRQVLYQRIRKMKRIIVCARVSKRLMFRFAPGSWTFNDKVIAIARESFAEFAVLQSNFHEDWAWKYGSTLKADLNYVAKTCHGTFPFPSSMNSLEEIGRQYEAHRCHLMLKYNEGLTAIYNRFHDANNSSSDVEAFRCLQVQLDLRVASAYGINLDLGHAIHKTRHGTRYTISESARRQVLDLLLALNHQRHAEEKAEEILFGVEPKVTTRRGRKKADAAPGPAVSLFDEE